MTMRVPPPQAFTKEIATQAYNWLQSQPDSIRQQADNMNSVVAMYLRAKRNGEVSLEASAPVSTENFRQNLKTLAAEMQQFAAQPLSKEPTGQINSPSFAGEINPDFLEPMLSQGTAPESAEPVLPRAVLTQPRRTPPAAPTMPAQTAMKNQAQMASPTDGIISKLDSRSRSMVASAQEKLNLSSEGEALRALIALGFARLEKI